jgi:iron complex outermembrane receptor protein
MSQSSSSKSKLKSRFPTDDVVRKAVRYALTGGTMMAAIGALHAQDKPAKAATNSDADQPVLTEVTVTGSRIVVPNATSISPITTVSSEEFAQVGATRVEDVLNQLPQVFADQNATSINGGNGTETVNLRGLQTKRTLVLIDGQRMSYGDPRIGGAGSDLKMIPTALIDNVEILTGGASSIYGADAVAGVVNFKLNDHFEGVKLVADGGGYFHHNTNNQNVITDLQRFNASSGAGFYEPPSNVATGAQKQLTFIAGLNSADNKGNATFFASYRNIAAAVQSNFSYSACSLASGFVAAKGKAYNGNFNCSGSLTSYPGTFLKYVGGTTSDANTVGPNGLLPLSAEHRFNYGPLNYMQAPDETWNAGAFMHYDLTEHATVYMSTMFMDDRTVLQIAPSGDFGNTVSVNCANPYLTADMVSTWCGGSTAGTVNSGGAGNGLYILRRNVEGGNRQDDEEHTDYRLTVGVKGAITDDWTYDANYQWSIVNLTQTYNNDVSVEKMNYATDVVNGPNGPECAVTAAGVTTGLAAGCVPWNIFQPGGVSKAAVAYLNTPGLNRGQVKQQIVELNLTGDLSKFVTLPTAHDGLRVAFGGEYRDVRSFTLPDEEFQSGDLAGQGGRTLPVSGGIVSRDAYLEARLPIMQDMPFAKSLDFDGSYRYSAYSLGFNTNTFSAGLDWAPTQDVRLRGTFTRATRAPNVTELFATQSVGLDGTIDPCAGSAPNLTAAQCARTGLATSRYGSLAANPASQYNGLTGGNPTLKPETALTTSFGIGFTPTVLPNFRAQIDYYDIKIENVIESIGENLIINECATADLYCNLVHRDATGSLWLTPTGYVTDTLANVGQLEEKGIDFDISYSYNLGTFGKIRTTFNGTHIIQYGVTPVAQLASSTYYNCSGLFGASCSGETNGSGGPVFQWRHDWATTWSTPVLPIDLTLRWRFMSSVRLESTAGNANLGYVSTATIANGGVSNTDYRIPSFSYLDTSVAYRVTDKITTRLGCNNLLDKSPPVIGATNLPGPPIGNGNTMPGTYDWGGRFVFANFEVQF